jgi:hypothetical protein
MYTGAGATGKQEHRTQAVFNHTEDYGIFFSLLYTCWLGGSSKVQSSTALFKVVTYLTIQHKLSGAFQNDRGQQMFCQTEPFPYIKYSIFIFTPKAASCRRYNVFDPSVIHNLLMYN